MNLTSREQFEILNYPLEVCGIQGNIFENYPEVIKGYIFHFSLGDSLLDYVDYLENEFKFPLAYHWKKSITGSLDELKIKLEVFKQALLTINENHYEGLDKFAFINIFIISKDNQYQLVITSDTFDISKMINLE